jgi:hypothetical protein
MVDVPRELGTKKVQEGISLFNFTYPRLYNDYSAKKPEVYRIDHVNF